MGGMEGDASDATLLHLLVAVLSVADDRAANRRKLRTNLILQSRHQGNPHQGSSPKRALDGIPKFSTSRSRVALSGQPLKLSISSKVVNERPFLRIEMPSDYRKILPHRSMA